MKLLCFTDKSCIVVEPRNVEGKTEYFILDSNVSYLRELIKGKKCRQPREEMQLEIYLNAVDILETGRIRSIRKAD